MKNLFLAAVITLFGISNTYAQQVNTDIIPTTFTEMLIKEYPNAKEINWRKNGNDYKVEFEDGKMNHEVWFTKEGEKVRVEKEITSQELPTILVDFIKQHYDGYKIDSVESTEKNGITTYVVELEKSWNEEIRITFSATGKVLHVTKD